MDLNFFNDLQQSLEQEATRKDEIRTTVKELDRACRQLNATLNQVHADPTGPVPNLDFTQVQETLQTLAKLIPDNEFYKYNDLWSRTTQQAVFLIVFKSYLDRGEIINIIPTVEETLLVKVDIHNDLNEFHIQLEDILHAYITLINELSRLCVNSVTVGDYERPLAISKHVKDLSAGFQILNLKNDILRKRFDSIKYDVKKIEEVVYDITLRGLHNGASKKRNLADESDQPTTPAKIPKN
ncbi:translation elongation factor EF-1 alpha [Mucor velutinosus]|uniref:Translation elongation factor EF-1 alpha n=1 Tax=Mucor velutinosus TaxID=708070 RepID=A0AAN7DH49_9FUNG|nr:translation elongation factor EF-1 alpha [Mucor velutinosus]